MHLQVLQALRDHVQQARFVAISLNEVTSCDNGQWLCIHIYVVLDWIKVPLLLNIVKVERQGDDSLFGMIESALQDEGGLSREEIGKKLICFEAHGVNVI
jgi:hypothetical protein